ncbi:MAG: PrsW family intramembrane metalloprotease, partial [Candidatus Doudnabacteria bacterium]|nr:PrsW family intramembrane metalloprotease [Candidatus Doudnabacteria bacterium]
AIATGIVGYHLAMARFSDDKRKGWIFQGLSVAIILHALYNIIASTDTALTMWLIAILLVTMFVLLARGMKEVRTLGVLPQSKATNSQLSTTPSSPDDPMLN